MVRTVLSVRSDGSMSARTMIGAINDAVVIVRRVMSGGESRAGWDAVSLLMLGWRKAAPVNPTAITNGASIVAMAICTSVLASTARRTIPTSSKTMARPKRFEADDWGAALKKYVTKRKITTTLAPTVAARMVVMRAESTLRDGCTKTTHTRTHEPSATMRPSTATLRVSWDIRSRRPPAIQTININCRPRKADSTRTGVPNVVSWDSKYRAATRTPMVSAAKVATDMAGRCAALPTTNDNAKREMVSQVYRPNGWEENRPCPTPRDKAPRAHNQLENAYALRAMRP